MPPPDETAQSNLHPVFERLVQRAEREAANGHRGAVIWLTGLSGSGKSTVAAAAERTLFAEGMHVRVLDGDNVRTGLSAGLGFSLDDRRENVRRIAEVAKLMCETGVVTLCSFVSPTRAIRALARGLVGDGDFAEVYVSADLDTCERRDVKGLYAKARAGEIRGFTGIDSPYESPEAPDLRLATAEQSVAESARLLADFVRERTRLAGHANPPR